MAKLSHNLKVKEAQRLAKQVNQRFYRLEKKSIGLRESAYRYAQAETNKEKPRYTTNINKISSMSEVELTEFMLSLRKKVKSPSSTIRGLRGVENRRIENSIYILNKTFNVDINKDEYIDFIENGGGNLLNKYMDSKQLVKDWLDKRKQGITTKEFIKTYNRYLNRVRKPFDQADVEKSFKKIIDKKAASERK
mgnify:FL=1